MSFQKSDDELLLAQVNFMLKVSPASLAPAKGKRSQRGDTLWCSLNSKNDLMAAGTGSVDLIGPKSNSTTDY